jgi:hypothetical protein
MACEMNCHGYLPACDVTSRAEPGLNLGNRSRHGRIGNDLQICFIGHDALTFNSGVTVTTVTLIDENARFLLHLLPFVEVGADAAGHLFRSAFHDL